jgi:hypothetical protein
MSLRGRISREIIGYGIVPVRRWGEGEGSLRRAVDGSVVGAVAEGAGFHEIACRGPSKCGTFVSVRPLDACPKCGSSKVMRRAAEPASKTKT